MPFTVDQFFQVFRDYNSGVGLSVWFFYLMAASVLFGLFARRNGAVSWALGFLSLLWIWMGVVYHGIYFSRINPAAVFFGSLFFVQGGIFLWALKAGWLSGAITKDSLRLRFCFLMVAYALVLYPLLGLSFGHGYPAGPIFGLPCPTTIFTLGLLMIFQGSLRRRLILHAIPVLWTVVGTFAATSMSVYEDYALLVSSILALWFLWRTRDSRETSPAVSS